jgi:hypothetical protein
MFKVIIGLEDIGEYEKFYEAVKVFLKKIKAKGKEGMSLAWLASANWIEHEIGFIKCTLDFYDVRDFAFIIGVLNKDGEIIEEAAPEIPAEAIDRIFLRTKMGLMEHAQDKLAEFRKVLEEAIEEASQERSD